MWVCVQSYRLSANVIEWPPGPLKRVGHRGEASTAPAMPLNSGPGRPDFDNPAMPAPPALTTLLRRVSHPVWRAQRLRQGLAALAVALGVALAFAVHLIHGSALDAFESAGRRADAAPDWVLQAAAGDFDEGVLSELLALPAVAQALPLLEARLQPAEAGLPALRVLGLDALAAASLAPTLRPRPEGREPLAALDPGLIFLNAAAQQALGRAPGSTLRLIDPAGQTVALAVGGDLADAGPPLAVMDLAGLQPLADRLGRLSRIELRLAEGVDREAFRRDWQQRHPPEAGLQLQSAADRASRLAGASRAYRVNLTVLAGIALFTGAFLVHAVLALAVAQRLPQLALLGVLGVPAGLRRRLVLAESALIGGLGSAAGLLLGAGLAWLALRLLGGDLGGGYFPATGAAGPGLQVGVAATLVHGGLGLGAALVGGWGPARAAERLAPTQVLKGVATLDGPPASRLRAWVGPLMLPVGLLLSLLPPLAGLPLGAYLGIALMLLGGIACVPGLARLLPAPAWAQGTVRAPASAGWHTLLGLALARARRQRQQATVVVAGVVASLALSVALTVMVGSFRGAVSDWLDAVLPAALYARLAPVGGETPPLPPGLREAAAALPGVRRVDTLQSLPLQLDPARPAVMLIARSLPERPQDALPLIGPPWRGPAGEPAVWVSEAFARLHGSQPGDRLLLPLPDAAGRHRPVALRVHGIWRDYARQHGALVIDRRDHLALGGRDTPQDLAISLDETASVDTVAEALRAAATRLPGGQGLELQRADGIRRLSLEIFDRSFAITRWLQAVAIGIGLFGVAASLSAQVLARRREFGLLLHLGFGRRQLLALVTAEAAVWSLLGIALGLALGLAIAAVLILVVNPQSFHWTLPMQIDPLPLAGLALAVLLATAAAAAAAARRAPAVDPVRAVREDLG